MKADFSKEFDVKVEIKIKVMPRAVPSSTGDEIIWRGIESSIDWEGRKLGYSLKGYFESMAKEMVDRLLSEEKGSSNLA